MINCVLKLRDVPSCTEWVTKVLVAGLGGAVMAMFANVLVACWH